MTRTRLATVAATVLVPAGAEGATIAVNTTKDEYGTGGKCSLREAVEAANTDAAFGGCPKGQGADKIALGAGAHKLSIDVDTTTEDANVEGDLDVASTVTIAGAGADKTRIEANGEKLLERALNQHSGKLTVKGLTIRDAVEYDDSDNGGAIYNEGPGELTVERSRIVDNYAYYYGGGIASVGGTTKVIKSTVADNQCDGYGGGLYYEGPDTLLIKDSTVAGNQCDDGVGGVWGEGGTLKMIRTTVTQNVGYDYGGGVEVDGVRATIKDSTISHNYNHQYYGGGFYDEGVTRRS